MPKITLSILFESAFGTWGSYFIYHIFQLYQQYSIFLRSFPQLPHHRPMPDNCRSFKLSVFIPCLLSPAVDCSKAAMSCEVIDGQVVRELLMILVKSENLIFVVLGMVAPRLPTVRRRKLKTTRS